MSAYLGGYLVGLGKKTKEGTLDYTWLEKPISNRIVSQGLDYLCTYNGTDSVLNNQFSNVNMWRRGYATEVSNYPVSGAIQYLGVGTDATPTEFEDTDLHAPVGTPIDSVAMTGGPFCGTLIPSNTYELRHRITLQSSPMENDTEIRELGWYGKYYNQDVYKMFARVALDYPVRLLAGERVVCTYELRVTYGDLTPSIVDDFFGLLDSTGAPLKAEKKLCIGSWVGWKDGWSATNIACPYINTDGVAGSMHTGTEGTYVVYGPYNQYTTSYSGYDHLRSDNLWYSTSSTYNFPGYLGRSPAMSYDSSSSRTTFSLNHYTPGDHHRDITINVTSLWPNLSVDYIDIYAIMNRAMCYRFGYYNETTDPDTGEVTRTWVPQAWRKYNDRSYKFTFRYQFDTVDTINQH